VKRHKSGVIVWHNTHYRKTADAYLNNTAPVSDAEMDFEVQESRACRSDSERLWYAALEDAIMILRLGKKARGDGLYDETRRWVASHADYVGSFDFICAVLNLDAGYIRGALVRMKPPGWRWQLSHGNRTGRTKVVPKRPPKRARKPRRAA